MPDPTAPPSERRSILKEQSKILLERLIQAYPSAFLPTSERRVKPLKLGIHKDLTPIVKAWGYEAAVLRYALGGYTRQLRYQLALLKYPHRVDLQGEPAGDISEAHRHAAQEKVRLIKERRKLREQEIPQNKQRQQRAPTGIEGKRSEPATATTDKAISTERIAALQAKLSRRATL